MKVARIKSERQYETYRWETHKILTYGEHNDFPQAVDEIITASKTGSSCIDIYNDFVYGMGFAEPTMGDVVINEKGHTLSKLLRLITSDHTKFFGFALHVNYTLDHRIKSIHYVPYENVRLCTPDDDGVIRRVALHTDWGQRDKSRIRWSPQDIDRVDLFNPEPSAIDVQVEAAGGWDNYKGQVFYFSGLTEGEPTYSIPKYISVVTDMRTEEALSNVAGRNVCSNFMLAGALVEILDVEQTEAQVQRRQEELAAFQGDENALQLWYMSAKSREELPEFVPFTTNNYDKAFSVTQQLIPDNIGQALKQPPILRAKDVGANFGADLMTNAYKYYNSVTVRERLQITEALSYLFGFWFVKLDNPDFTIQPLIYNAGASISEKVGEAAMGSILSVIKDVEYSLCQRRNILKYGYGLTEDETLKLLPNELNEKNNTADTNGANNRAQDNNNRRRRKARKTNSAKPQRRRSFRALFKRG